MSERDYDLVVFGATSFVGEILCRTLVERIGTDGASGTRWAIAGRSQSKLDELAAATGAAVPRIVADALDADAMADLVGSTRAVVSTVGPYAKYGSPLVAAVVDAGIDYCDLTGEVQWMRAMIDQHHEQAERSGARVVHSCGFDSIPSDLGVWFLQQEAQARFGRTCNRVGLRVKAMKGGVSGGTLASMYNVAGEAAADPAIRRQLANPYSLNPEALRSGPRQPEVLRPQRDGLTGQWVGPFVMGPVNSRVVQRTHALLGRPWGDDFVYDEAILTGDSWTGGAAASALAVGSAAAVAGAAFGPTRRLLERFGPQPGDGPSLDMQQEGFFDIRIVGRTADGQQLTAKVTGDRDPGYGSTARMLAEAALAFAHVPAHDRPGGFWTSASLFGQVLIDRLQSDAGLGFEILD
jgi:short subunit dehydrogenase-like uncharacterized protein